MTSCISQKILILFAGAVDGFGGGHRVGVEIEGKIAADETDLARVDVVLLQLREAVGFEAAAEGALVVSELDHDDRRVVAAQNVPALADAHLDLVVSRRGSRGGSRFGLRCRGLLVLEQLTNRFELVQDCVGLIARDAVGHVDGDRSRP